jgi:glycosyltransferase involved in cell wall biosynthesis
MSKTNSDFEKHLDSSPKPLVSVIMNCYNGEQYLREALDSVMAQTYQNWELVFWDNQSTDRSAEIYSSYSDPRLVYYYSNEHTGLGQARVEAIKLAKGEWLGILDTDDFWHYNKLSSQLKLLESVEQMDQVGFIFSKWKIIGDNDETIESPKNKFDEKLLFENLLLKNFILFSSVLINRKAYQHLGGISQFFNHSYDYDLLLRLSKSYKGLYLDEISAYYRIHPQNLSKTQFIQSFEEDFAIIAQYFPAKVACLRLVNIAITYLMVAVRKKEFKTAFNVLALVPISKLIVHVVTALQKRISRAIG